MECIGIAGMASVNVKDGVAKLLKKENAGRGVNVYIVNNKLKIELHVIVAYGVSIRAVAQNVLENVRYKIEEFTGLEIEAINVVVEGVAYFASTSRSITIFPILVLILPFIRHPPFIGLYSGSVFQLCII